MKTPMIYFYREVAGCKGGSTATATAAMHRWGIPVLQGNGTDRVFRYVDASDELLAKAKAAHAEESVRREAAKGNGHAHKAKERAVTDSEVIAMLTKLDDGLTKLGDGLRRIEMLLNVGIPGEMGRTEAKIDSLIQYLQTRAQPTRRKS